MPRETQMKHVSTTPFGRRPVTAGLLAARALAKAPAPQSAQDKWTVLNDLCAARAVFGVTDRDLTVLHALASFHQARTFEEGTGLIVFPSNAALSDRAHGMAESTLRRHLAALVAAGLILRHDSPNGKRYAARDGDGTLAHAFGFDLRPLLVRSGEIHVAAQAVRAATEALRRRREAVVVMLRDAAKLIAYGQETVARHWDDLAAEAATLQRALRRTLDAPTAELLWDAAQKLLAMVNAALFQHETEEVDGNAAGSERHIQDSNRDSLDSELPKERGKAAGKVTGTDLVPAEPEAGQKLPLHLVLRACPDLKDYAQHGIRDWRDLVAVAGFVRPMLGISPDAWAAAMAAMSPAGAAITLACMLQRAKEIAKPGGYLRALTRKAEEGAFSPGPMVMALLKTENDRAA